MAVKNYEQYTVTEHAKKRILTRFNITNKEFEDAINTLEGKQKQKEEKQQKKWQLSFSKQNSSLKKILRRSGG